MMVQAVYFDMDNTIANLYDVPNWLKYLVEDEDTYPYEVAAPMQPMEELNTLCTALVAAGIVVGVCSWAAKGSSNAYKAATARAKREWLARYLPAVQEVHIIAYGTPKAKRVKVKRNAVLIDDDSRVRESWDNDRAGRTSIDPANCVEFMRHLVESIVTC